MYLINHHTRAFQFGVLLIGLLSVPALGQPVKQKWLDSTEKSTIEAEFVRLVDGAVVLKKDGKEIAVPLSKLSLASHLQALKLAKPGAYSKPAPKIIVGLQPTPESEKLLENPFPANATVEQFMDTLIAQLDAQNPMVVWHALTPEMQTDVEDLIVSAIDAGGSGLLVQVRSLMKQLATLMTEKQQFVLGSSLAATNPQLRQQVTVLTAVATALADKQNWDAENFKSGKVAPWLAGMSVKLGSAGNSLLTASIPKGGPGAPPQSAKQALDYKVLSQSEDKAEIQLLNPSFNALVSDPQTGQMKPGKEARKIELLHVSGKWLPKIMVDDWNSSITQAKFGVTQVMPLARTGLAAVIPMVSSLANAKSQQEFNAALQQLMRPGQGLAGQPGMGGPGMMGPGMMGPGMGGPGMGGPGKMGPGMMGGMSAPGGMSASGPDSSGLQPMPTSQ